MIELAFFNFYPNSILKNQIYNSTRYLPLTNKIFINFYIFKNLFSSNSGGSISITSNTIITCIFYNLFHSCYSLSHGGACYFECNFLNIQYCNFFNCSQKGSSTYGSAFFSSNNKFSLCIFNSFLDNQNKNLPDFHCTSIIQYGEVFTEFTNSSYSSHLLVSGIYHYQISISKIKYYTSAYHNSGSTIGFGIFSLPGDHSYINFIKNNCSRGVIHFSQATFTLSNVIFYQNNGNIIDNNGYSGTLTLINSIFDFLMNTGPNALITSNCSINNNIKPNYFIINLSNTCFLTLFTQNFQQNFYNFFLIFILFI